MDRLQFKSVLIVEDEPFIAMDIEQVLGDMGFRDVTMVGSQEEARAWLETHTPDVAIIDVILRDGESSHLADLLAVRKIPVVVHSAMPELYGSFHVGPIVSKPATPEEIADAIFSAPGFQRI